MVDRIADGEDVSVSDSGSGTEADSVSSAEQESAEQELGLFFGGGERRLEGSTVNPAALAMSATFVGMQLSANMQHMVHLAHEVVKKCMHADALAAFQLAGRHMRNMQYMEGRFRANGKEIAVELANATKAYEHNNPHEFGNNIGLALRKVLLSNTNNTDLPEGPAGYTVGVLCRGIERQGVLRGQVICAPGATTTHTKFKANIYLAKKDEGGRSNPVMPGYMPVFYFRTCDVTGKIETMASSEGTDVQMAMPGDDVTCSCELIASTPIEKGMRFAMREGGKTIGQGLIVETL